MFLLVPSYAYAQEDNANIEYDRCEYDMINQNVYAPFYFHIIHDEAISQEFNQRHDDNPNVNPFVRSEDVSVVDEYPTWFEFGSSQNATATYEFQLELQYKEEVDYARPIMIQLFSEGTLMMDKKIYQEDKIGCIAFKLFVTPPPHEFTYEELLEIAKSEFIGTTRQYAMQIEDNTSMLGTLTNIIIVLVLVFAVVVGYLILNDKSRSRLLQTLKDEYDVRNDLLSTAIIQLKANLIFAKLQLSETKISNDSMINTIIGNFGHMMESMQTGVRDIKDDFKAFIDQLRKESEIPESANELAKTTFADIEKHDSSDDCIIIPKQTKKKDVDDSKLSQLIGLFGIGKKKEEPIFPETDKLKEEWSKMKNEELLKLYTDYANKSETYYKENLKHGSDYEYAVIILQILNDRNTDVSDNG